MDAISREEARNAGLKRFFTNEPCKIGHLAERHVSTGGCVECARLGNSAYVARRLATDLEFRKKRFARVAKFRADYPDKDREYEMRHRANNPLRAITSGANATQWRKDNPQRHKATCQQWRDKSRDKICAYNKRAYAVRDKEALRRKQADYRRANKEKIRKWIKDWEQRNPERAAFVRKAARMNRRQKETAGGDGASGREIANLFMRYQGKCIVCFSPDRIEVDHFMPLHLNGSNDPSNLQLLCKTCNLSKGKKHPDIWLASFDAPVRERIQLYLSIR